MDVSVVIPTHNRSALLSRTLRSALRQVRVDFEVIVVDEASNDDTPALLSALDDRRVRVLRHEIPRGLSAARNHGAEHARAEWLAFLDDDDLWAPDKLFRQVSAARETGREWAYTGSVNIANGRIVRISPAPSEEEVMATLPRFPILRVVDRMSSCGGRRSHKSALSKRVWLVAGKIGSSGFGLQSTAGRPAFVSR